MPTIKNSAPVLMPWFTICIVAPVIAWLVNAKVPSTMKPKCATDE